MRVGGGLGWLRGWVDRILPGYCCHCRRSMTHNGVLCHVCRDELQMVTPEWLSLWHGSLASELIMRGVYGWAYEGAIRTVIRQAKYHGNPRAIQWIVSQSESVMRRAIHELQPEVMIPIPSARVRFVSRGFNLPTLIAHSVGPVDSPVASVVIRVKETPPLAGLSKSDRRRELAQAFQVVPGSIAGKRVLLVDDIVTTGSTAQGVEQICYDAGATRVELMGLAITPMHRTPRMTSQ